MHTELLESLMKGNALVVVAIAYMLGALVGAVALSFF